MEQTLPSADKMQTMRRRLELCRDFWRPSHMAGAEVFRNVSTWQNQWSSQELQNRLNDNSRHLAGYNMLDTIAKRLQENILAAPLSMRTTPDDSITEQQIHEIMKRQQAQQAQQQTQQGIADPYIMDDFPVRDFGMSMTYNNVLRSIEKQSAIEEVHAKASDQYTIFGYTFFDISVSANPYIGKLEVMPKAVMDPSTCYVDPQGQYEGNWMKSQYCFDTHIKEKSELIHLYGLEAVSQAIGNNMWDEGNIFSQMFHRDSVSESKIPVVRYFEIQECDCYVLTTKKGQVFRVWNDKMSSYMKEKGKTEAEVVLADMLKFFNLMADDGATFEKMKLPRTYWGIIGQNRMVKELSPWYGGVLPLVPVTPPMMRVSSQSEGDYDAGPSNYGLFYKSPLHDSIGPQRQLNYAIAKELEVLSRAADDKMAIGQSQMIPEQTVEGALDPTAGAFLFDDRRNPNPPQRAFANNAPLNLLGSANIMQDRLYRTIGVPGESMGAASPYQSGKAIEAISMGMQASQDTSVIAYQKSVKDMAKRILSIIPVVYDAEMINRINSPTSKAMPIHKIIPKFSGEGGDHQLFDMLASSYDLSVTLRWYANDFPREIKQMMMELGSRSGMPPEVSVVLMSELLGHIPMESAAQASQMLLNAVPDHMLTEEQRMVRQATKPPEEPSIDQQIKMLELKGAEKRAEAAEATSQSKQVEAILDAVQNLEQAMPAMFTEQIAETLKGFLVDLTVQSKMGMNKGQEQQPPPEMMQ